MSKIIDNAEKEEPTDVMCVSCVGTFQRLYIQPSGLFTRKIFAKWFYKCTHCPFQSKVYCSRIKDLQIK